MAYLGKARPALRMPHPDESPARFRSESPVMKGEIRMEKAHRGSNVIAFQDLVRRNNLRRLARRGDGWLGDAA